MFSGCYLASTPLPGAGGGNPGNPEGPGDPGNPGGPGGPGGPGDTPVTFSNLTADGSATATTTTLTLTFSAAITGLSASDITLSGVGVTKGTLSGTGPTYILPISGVTAGGTLTITVTKTGYTISGSQTVTIYVFIEMVQVPGGSFEMGKEFNPNNDLVFDDVTPVHTVTLTGFYIGKYEVTQAQWQAVMGSLPSDLTSNNYGKGDNFPVYFVSWYDALVFCNKLSMAEGLTPAYRISGSTNPNDWGTVPEGFSSPNRAVWDAVEVVSGSTGYRLPTEAQWEYAAKGGNGSPGNYTFAGSNNVDDVAWYDNNSGSATHAVGTKAPNGLGIYDMSGNVAERCWDWYETYSSGAQTDPTGASSGGSTPSRVSRGGNWFNPPLTARSVQRSLVVDGNPYDRGRIWGFRVVRP